eukprot:snap_masked-scaffold_30-processed-gene-3.43-mRNA-1 protein AED:1.00 eAED:1.00 QI:0/0/0/0/1/1/2/0/215
MPDNMDTVSGSNVLREVSRNNRREEECCMDFEIEKLTDLSKQSCELFISQYERLNSIQKKRVNLNLRMDMAIFKHLKRLNVTKTNNILIKHLQEIVDEEKIKELKSPDQMILENARFKLGILEESAVKSMFSEVREILELLPEESAKSKKKICSSIFKLLPSYIWVRQDMLAIKPSLCSPDLQELEKYILECIPPYHVRLKMRRGKVYENDIKIE